MTSKGKHTPAVIHKSSVHYMRLFGVLTEITGTLCGRSRSDLPDGINVGKKVTCKVCLRALEKKS